MVPAVRPPGPARPFIIIFIFILFIFIFIPGAPRCARRGPFISHSYQWGGVREGREFKSVGVIETSRDELPSGPQALGRGL